MYDLIAKVSESSTYVYLLSAIESSHNLLRLIIMGNIPK